MDENGDDSLELAEVTKALRMAQRDDPSQATLDDAALAERVGRAVEAARQGRARQDDVRRVQRAARAALRELDAVHVEHDVLGLLSGSLVEVIYRRCGCLAARAATTLSAGRRPGRSYVRRRWTGGGDARRRPARRFSSNAALFGVAPAALADGRLEEQGYHAIVL